MRALVVGCGSIGRRHARVLAGMGFEVAVASRRAQDEWPRYATVAEAVRAHRPDYVVIADETARHAESLASLERLGFDAPVLVEKPLFATPAQASPPRNPRIYVGYDLRFHPLLARLRARLAGARVVSAEIHVGQHLADWRPGRDWRAGYSANAALGGGALRDLSHELDYLLWLFGPWRRLAALGGNYGALGVDSDESFALLVECAGCPIVTVALNCLDRPLRRAMVVNTTEATLSADFVTGVLAEGATTETLRSDGDGMYRAEHEAALAGEDSRLCRYEDGLAVVRMIDAAERAAAAGAWVEA